MLFYAKGNPEADLSPHDLRDGLQTALDAVGPVRNMLIVPPDITRLASHAGELTRYLWQSRPEAVKTILPALGTHLPMEDAEISVMFGDIPRHLFRAHRWRTDCTQAGIVPAGFIESVSGGAVRYEVPISVNRLLLDPAFDCIFSISQVVPHEVAGMAGYSKNIIVGLGGAENIHKTHFLGAAYGMERIMGRADTPVRRVLDYAIKEFFGDLRLIHAITVIGTDKQGKPAIRGIFIGDDDECYLQAAQLSRIVNIHVLDEPLRKVVTYLDPTEYRSTWLGNKSIYRTRMAIADGGELVVIAPGVKMFGEDQEIDALIRRFGYCGTASTMAAVKKHAELRGNLSAAAHLIHGSPEGRFSITYCTGVLSREEVEHAGFRYAPVDEMISRYNPKALKEGYNRLSDGEEIYFIPRPGSGLWVCKQRYC